MLPLPLFSPSLIAVLFHELFDFDKALRNIM